MTISFEQMPASRRTPGRYVEFNTTLASRGLAAFPVRALFIGQRLASGAKAEAELTPVFSVAEARGYFGRGSQLALMLEAAFNANPNLNAYAIALDDAGSAVAAVHEVTFSGTATSAGVVRLYVAGKLVELAVAVGDTAASVATDLAALLTTATAPDLPITGSDTTASLDLTARNGGTQGNDIDIRIESTAAGLTGAVTDPRPTDGATDPDAQTALDAIGTEDFDFVCLALNDATNVGKLRTHLNTLIHPLESRGAHGVYCTSGTLSAATTLADNFITDGFITAGFTPDTVTWDPEAAAIYTAVLASQEDPALPYNGLVLEGMLPAWTASPGLTSTEVETLLHEGVTPFVRGADGRLRIVRAISTRTQNEAAAADSSLLDVTTGRVLLWASRQVRTVLSRYARAKNIERRRAAIRGDLLVLMAEAEALEILRDVADFEDALVVETNATDPARVDVSFPVPTVHGMHVIAVRADLR